jgi:hypothetical protein
MNEHDLRWHRPWRRPRVAPTPSARAVVEGVAPVGLVMVASAALLWGTGQDLGAHHGPVPVGTTRSATAWLAATGLLLLLAYWLVSMGADSCVAAEGRSGRCPGCSGGR